MKTDFRSCFSFSSVTTRILKITFLVAALYFYWTAQVWERRKEGKNGGQREFDFDFEIKFLLNGKDLILQPLRFLVASTFRSLCWQSACVRT